MNGFFVTGIGTGIGKTLVSAVLVEALKADYWKPIQSGDLDFTDSDLAAKLDNKSIDLQYIKIPNQNNYLIVEGAGGLFVPLSDKYLIKDLIKLIQLPVIVVSMNYLGSINHTLLTIEALKQQNIPVAGIIFNGDANIESENYILNYTGITLLGKIPKADILSKGFIAQQADKLRPKLLSILPQLPNPPSSNDLPIDYESF